MAELIKKISIFCAFIIIAFSSVQADNKNDIKQIRKWYNATKKKIAYNQKSQNGSLYCNTLERNGAFHLKQEF